MSKSDVLENKLLLLIFNATAWANMADNAASSPNTNIYVSLHTSDPGEAGTQTTNEAAYPGYARQAVARTSGGWTVTANSVSPAANIDFPAATGSPSETETFAGIGKSVSGTGELWYSGAISPTIAVTTAGTIPRVTTATAITED